MTIRIGIMGSGQIVQRSHLPGFQEDGRCEVVAIAARDEQRLRDVAGRFRIPRFYTDWRAMLDAEELNAVTVASPPALHREMAVAALEQGLDVLIEKPLAPTLEDVDAIVAAADRSGRIAMVQQTLRYNPTFWRAAELVRAGEIGQVRRVHAALLNLGPRSWAPNSTWFFDPALAGGGVLLDSGVHLVDLVRHMTGSDVQDLNGEVVFPSAQGVEEEASLVAWLDSGVQATFDLSWHVDPPQVCIELFGTDGWLRADAKSVIPISIHRRSGGEFFPEVIRATWFGQVYRHFITSCTDRTTPLSSVADNQKTIAPILALYHRDTVRRRYGTELA